ncbi:hypothetical protein [Burkholderia cenocepacia]|uniref:hypothetical protein n=1 Tax=Burkholderia cenocepacia TaxID=95486 RepID=UPI001BA98325|nr:hypothetical protein [Burkholderia cenocepacia]QUN57384.1 hypothetical protein KEH58_30665 [Burkholderia cenocepacia]
MVKLVESSQWEEDLYQIETADPVEGGPDGVSNRQAKQLGGRTRYLKAQVEQSQSGLAQHIAAADPHSQYATKSDLAARLAELVGQAPGMLDTLKELADALGNDPNFATTITNQLGLKAPISSPVFTGTPKAPTQAQGDNSTALATTAFVKQSGESYSSIQGIATTATLNSGHVGAFIWAYGVGITLTLPPVAGVPNGATITIGAPVAVTIKGNASENINSQFGVTSNTFALNAGEQAQFISNGGAWYLSSYTTVLGATPPQFDNTTKLATTGFVQRAVGNYRSANGYVGSATLSTADVGCLITWDGNGTLTLPDATTVAGGSAIRVFKYAGPIASVLAANKPGQLNVPASGADTYTFAVGVFGFFELINESGIKWDVAGELFSQYGTTAAQFDNSSKLATTAFVQGALGNFRNQIGLSAATTLNGNAWGNAYTLFGGSPYNVTLPPLSSGVNGAAIRFSNIGSTAYTLVGAGSDAIFNGTTSNTLVLNPGDTVTLVSSGVWVMFGGSMSLPASGVMSGPGWKTQPQFDNSTKLATTAFVQRAVGAVVGLMRNASMSVPTVSASATFTADEIVVETALGGAAFRIANFNATINLGTTGAGGMDAGTAPASGFVAIYAIYNPTNGTTALLATNATSSVAPNVYSGANMPAGYAASALVSVWSTNSSRQFGVGFQVDRTVNLTSFSVLSTSVQQSSYAPFSVASYIPPNAKLVSGYTNCGSTAASIIGSGVSGSSTGIGSAGTNGQSILTLGAPFSDVPMVTPQTMFYVATASAGTMTFSCFISSYKF